jgi:1-acyl-sn-glycerol-3-phosphate acyltransferase
MKLTGWRAEGSFPFEIPRFVLVGAHHTSNWDVFYGAICVYSLGLFDHWKPLVITKMQAMTGWMGVAMRRMGGLGIDRSRPNQLVQQVIEQLKGPERVVLVISPEGARKKTDYWKSGFYHIALGAQVPLVLATLNYARKLFIASPPLYLSGDVESDLAQIRAFYANTVAKYPDQAAEIRFKPA